MISVTGFIARGGDGDAAGWRDETLRFAEVVAQVIVNGLLDGVIFVDLEELGGQGLGGSDCG